MGKEGGFLWLVLAGTSGYGMQGRIEEALKRQAYNSSAVGYKSFNPSNMVRFIVVCRADETARERSECVATFQNWPELTDAYTLHMWNV